MVHTIGKTSHTLVKTLRLVVLKSVTIARVRGVRTIGLGKSPNDSKEK